MRQHLMRAWCGLVPALLLLAGTGLPARADTNGAVYTTDSTGTVVNGNVYATKDDVYINGGPQTKKDAGLTPKDTCYYFQVTNPSGSLLLSTDDISSRAVYVDANGRDHGLGSCGGTHAVGTPDLLNGSTPVQLSPYADTDNPGGEYKVWLTPVADYDPNRAGAVSADCHWGFVDSDSKTDNFKVTASVIIPSSLLSGVKYLDCDQDGVLNPADLPLQNWEIDITDLTDSSKSTSTFTNILGQWSYFLPATDSFTVTEVLQPGWTQIAPADTSIFGATASQDPTTTLWVWTGTAAADVAGMNFWNIPLPDSVIISANPGLTVCNGTPCTLTALPSGGTGSFHYLWSTGDTTPSITVTTSGTYSVTVSDAAGCQSSSTSATVTELPPVAVKVDPANQTVCSGKSATFTATGSGGTGTGTFSWTLPDNSTSTGPTVTSNLVGNYSVTYTDATCGSANSSATLSADSAIVVSVNSPEVCSGASVTLTAGVTGGRSPYHYAWTGPGGPIAGDSSSITFTASAANAGNYSVLVTDSYTTTDNTTCSGSGSGTLKVHALPSAAISAPTSVCALSTGNTASVPAGTGDAAGATFVWTISGTWPLTGGPTNHIAPAITAGQGTNQITWSAGNASAVTIGVTVTSGFGCVAPGSTNVGETICTSNIHTATMGFWGNSNGQPLLNAADFVGPAPYALNLAPQLGHFYTNKYYTSSAGFGSVSTSTALSAAKTNLKNYLGNATATVMAYMLSAQTATMELNVNHSQGGVNNCWQVSAPTFLIGTTLFVPNSTNLPGYGNTLAGYISIKDLIADALTALGTSNVVQQTYIKDLLDTYNNGWTTINNGGVTPANGVVVTSCP